MFPRANPGFTTPATIQYRGNEFSVGKITRDGLWGCEKCSVGDHFLTRIACTNCFKSVNPKVPEMDEGNKENEFRSYVNFMDGNRLDRMRGKFPEQAQKVEDLKKSLDAEKRQNDSIAKSLVNKYSPPNGNPQFTPAAEQLLDFPVSTRKDDLNLSLVSSGAKTSLMPAGQPSKQELVESNSAPSIPNPGLPPINPKPRNVFTATRSSTDAKQGIAGGLYTPDVITVPTVVQNQLPSPCQLLQKGDTPSSSEKYLQDESGCHHSVSSSNCNAGATVASQVGCLQQGGIRLSEDKDYESLPSEYKKFATKYHDMSVFHLITEYAKVSSVVQQVVNTIKSKLLALGINKESFTKEYGSLASAFIFKSYHPSWQLLISSHTYSQFLLDLKKACPELYLQAETIVQEQYEETGKKSKTLPLGHPPNYNNVIYEDYTMLTAHILFRTEITGKGFYKRAKKTAKERLRRCLNELIGVIFDSKKGAEEKEEGKIEKDSIEGINAPSSSELSKVLGPTENGEQCSTNNEKEIVDLLNREPLHSSGFADEDSEEDEGSEEDEVAESNDSHKDDPREYDVLLDLVSFFTADLQAARDFSLPDPLVTLRFTKASFNTLIANPSTQNPPPNVIICMIGLADILADLLRAIIFQAKAVRDLKAIVLLVPTSFNNEEKLINSFVSSFQERLKTLSRKTVYSQFVKLQYMGKDNRQAVVLTTYEMGKADLPAEVEKSLIAAKEKCSKIFRKESQHSIGGGVHATRTSAVKAIIKYLIPAQLENQVIWEIGVGYPKFAFMLSVVSKRAVLCNDIPDVMNQILDHLPTELTKSTSLKPSESRNLSGNKRHRDALNKQVEKESVPEKLQEKKRNSIHDDEED